jgi:ankyrin repeat protein
MFPVEVFTIVAEYLSLHDISSLVLVSKEINHWVDLNDVIREYYLTNGDPLLDSCRLGFINLLMYLHKNGANITVDNDLPIRCASSHGHLHIVKYLYENGADVTADNEYAIRAAVYNDDLDMTRYLYKIGSPRVFIIRAGNEQGHVARYVRENGGYTWSSCIPRIFFVVKK